MADYIKITPLGGLDDNGKDCYVVEINNDIFVLDCGCCMPDKSIPGIDYILPNADYLIENKNRIKAYFITHGHDENMSGLKYFYDKAPAPIYVTLATKMYFEAEVKSARIKTKFDFKIVEPSSSFTINGHRITLFQTCHNACYSYGVCIHTDRGNIVYTGDFIVDYALSDKEYICDLHTLEELSNEETLLLMSESKTANLPGYCSPKHRVSQTIGKYFSDEKRIFIDCFYQNHYRIHEIINLCKENHKKLYLYNKYTEEIMAGYFQISDSSFAKNSILKSEDLLRCPKKDVVILILGRSDELFYELQKIATQTNEDRRIVLNEDDIFINAALPLVSQETLATRSIDSLYRTGCQVVWVKKGQVTSMHACQDDLKFFLSVLKPKYYFPVRGSFVKIMENAKLALTMGIGLSHMNVFVLDNGMQIEFGNSTRPTIIPNEVNKINVEPVLVDGRGIAKVGSEIIKERIKLGEDGVVVIASTVSKSKKAVIAGPDCQMRGFVFVKEAEPLLKSISSIYLDEVKLAIAQNDFSFENAKTVIEERCRRFIRRENGREPLIMPIVVIID